MKKLFFLILIIIAIVLVVVPVLKKEVPPLSEQSVEERHCFVRNVAATSEAPYAVSEEIELVFDGASVSGVKRGTQSGPDMTNGYQGTLSGTRSGDTLSLLFSYTIEGSVQKEQEEYKLQNRMLVKHHYPLLEKNGVLTPNKNVSFTIQEYSSVNCHV